MRYYPKRENVFWVEVVISKVDGSIETRKYRGVDRVRGCRSRFSDGDD